MEGPVPRNELSAILLMTDHYNDPDHCKEISRRVVDKIIFITDSTIALCWCQNTNKRLRSNVFSRMEPARRMIQWTLDTKEIPLFHIDGTSNITNILTKPIELEVCNVSVGSDC